MIEIKEIVSEIVDYVLRHGGITVDSYGIRPANGWAVALPGYEEEGRFDGDNPNRLWLNKLIRFYVEDYEIEIRREGYFGAWIDYESSRVVLDVVRVHYDHDSARNAGIFGGQEAIYNMENGRVVYLNKPEAA